MALKMKLAALICVLLTVACTALHLDTNNGLLLTLAITFGTAAYHFVMRLAVGGAINLLLRNRVNYRARWFRVSQWEQKLYKKLRVKKWKGKMATYDASLFDSRIHSLSEIAGAMCQAEIVHELIILFSFVPILAAIPFGALWVFVITSLLSACYDAMFVIMQRYNRPRVLRLIK